MMALDLSGASMNEQVVGKLVKILQRRPKTNNALKYILLTGTELGRDAVAKLQDAALPHNITINAFEDSPLLELEQLDADDDPMKEIREVQRKVEEQLVQKSKRSRFVIYSEDFPYESQAIAIKDNFNRCPEKYQEELRKLALDENPAPLTALIFDLENTEPKAETKAAKKKPDKKYKRARKT